METINKNFCESKKRKLYYYVSKKKRENNKENQAVQFWGQVQTIFFLFDLVHCSPYPQGIGNLLKKILYNLKEF